MMKKYIGMSNDENIFPLFQSLLLSAYYKEMEYNLRKPKEVFVHQRLIQKNISHFFNRCHSLEDSNESLWPIFPDLKSKRFHVLVIIFGHAFRTTGKEFVEKILKHIFIYKSLSPFFHSYHGLGHIGGSRTLFVSRNSPNLPPTKKFSQRSNI